MLYATLFVVVLVSAVVIVSIVCREPTIRSSRESQFLNHKRFASSQDYHNYAIVDDK